MNLTTIAVILMNMLTTVNVVLLTELLFGVTVSDRQKISKHCTAFGFCLFLNLIITACELGDTTQFLLIFLSMAVSVWYLAGFRLSAIPYLIPAILIDTEFATVLGLFDRLLSLEKYRFSLGEGSWTPLEGTADIFLLLLLSLCFYITRKKSLNIRLNSAETIVVTIFMLFLPIIDTGMNVIIEQSGRFTLMLGWTAFICVLNIALFYGVIHRNVARSYRQLSEDYKSQYETALKGIGKSSEMAEQDMRIGHDMKNHFIVVNEMLAKGAYEDAADYLGNLQKQHYPHSYKATGCKILDVLLAAKAEEIEHNHIELKVTGDMSLFDFMEPMDRTTLFSNLLDNAIAACLKIPEGNLRYIHMQTAEMGNRTALRIQNSAESHAPESPKGHRIGIGLGQIRQVAEKYHAACETSFVNGEYCVILLFEI